MGNGVLPEIDTAFILNLLHLKWHENGKAFSGQGTKSVDFACADWQRSIQPIKLLKFQHRKLAHMLTGHGKDSFGITVKLLLGIGGQYHGNNSKHHALVAGSQIIQKLLGFFTLEFHIIGHNGRKIVIGVLAALPVGDVGFYTKQAVLNFSHSFIRGHRQYINRQHHVAVEIGQFRDHGVLDIAGVVFQENDPAKLLAELQMVAVLFNAVRADIVPEVVAFLHHIVSVKMKGRFFTGAVEIVEDAQPLCGAHFHALGTERGKVGDKISAHA